MGSRSRSTFIKVSVIDYAMAKRVFIIHGWGGSPKGCWIPWLKKELEKMNFKVEALSMPNPENPKIEQWVEFLSKAVKKPDRHTYFVGHSVGCQTILRYLEKIKHKVGGAVFVAGWFSLGPDSTPTKEEKQIAKQWIETKIDFEKIKKITENFTAIFSDDDPDVPLKNSKLFSQKLHAKIVMEKNKGHFSDDAGVRELPVALEELLRISKLF